MTLSDFKTSGAGSYPGVEFIALTRPFGISILGGLNPAERVGVGDEEYELGTGEEELMISQARVWAVKRSELSNFRVSGSDTYFWAKMLSRRFRTSNHHARWHPGLHW